MNIHQTGCVPLLPLELELFKGDIRFHQTSDKSICFRIAQRSVWGLDSQTVAEPRRGVPTVRLLD